MRVRYVCSGNSATFDPASSPAHHSPSMVNLQSMFERKYHTFSRSTTHLI
ncbi:hypothetical protein PAMP_024923 [Pampus punctatissimus]